MKTLTGLETAALQAKLGAKPDGDWGPLTQAAFEKWAGLSPEPSPEPSPVTLPTGGRVKLDARSERNIQTLLPNVRKEFVDLLMLAKKRAADFGCDVRAISGNRTYDEQDALYAKGRTAPGPKVTNAKGGFSNHNFGIAVDLGVFEAGEYLDSENPSKAETVHLAIAEAVKVSGLVLEWGGDWKSFRDIPHWEYATGLTIAEKRQRLAAGRALV